MKPLPAADLQEAQRQSMLFQSVEAAIDDIGIDCVTLDDIARRAGISRTTIYRKVGGRDALLAAFIQHCFRKDIDAMRSIAIGPGSFAQRIEALVVRSVLNVREHPWLQRQLLRGLSEASLKLIRESCQQISEATLIELLAQGAADGTWTSPAPLDELLRWIAIQVFHHGIEQPDDVAAVQRTVRTYILPVLRLDTAPPPDYLERKIDAIYQHIVNERAGTVETEP